MYILLKYGRKNKKLLNLEFFVIVFLYLFSVGFVICNHNKYSIIFLIFMGILFCSWQITLFLKDMNEFEKNITQGDQ